MWRNQRREVRNALMFSSGVCIEADKKQKGEVESWDVNDFDQELADEGNDEEVSLKLIPSTYGKLEKLAKSLQFSEKHHHS